MYFWWSLSTLYLHACQMGYCRWLMSLLLCLFWALINFLVCGKIEWIAKKLQTFHGLISGVIQMQHTHTLTHTHMHTHNVTETTITFEKSISMQTNNSIFFTFRFCTSLFDSTNKNLKSMTESCTFKSSFTSLQSNKCNAQTLNTLPHWKNETTGI